MVTNKEYITVKELANILGISVSLVYRKLKRHNIEPVNIEQAKRFKVPNLYNKNVLDKIRAKKQVYNSSSNYSTNNNTHVKPFNMDIDTAIQVLKTNGFKVYYPKQAWEEI